MEIQRKRKFCYPQNQLIELIRRYFNESLQRREDISRFKKKANLKAISFNKDVVIPQLYESVSSEDVSAVIDRMEYTAVFYQGKTLWGFLVLTLQILVGDKEADKGDLVLYPTPNENHQDLALRVFDLYLEEQLNKIDLQPPRDLDETMLLSPKDLNLARRMMEADIICHGRI